MRVDSDTTAVITGAATGIGRSMALAFCRAGATVVIADIEEKRAVATARELALAGGRTIAAHVDVADSESVAALAERVYAELGRVDILCNNAGVSMRPFRASWDASHRDYHWIMGVNYFGVINGIIEFVPRMRAQAGHKQIVNTASFTALDVSPGHAPYAASKAAVIAVSDALRAELAEQGDDFGVTVLYAGAVPTDIVTSERLRAEADRSAARDVKAYVSSRPPAFHYEPRPVEEIGGLVVDAVRQELPAVLTHRYPHDEIELRLESLRAGYRP